jgi:hypothetical protein
MRGRLHDDGNHLVLTSDPVPSHPDVARARRLAIPERSRSWYARTLGLGAVLLLAVAGAVATWFATRHGPLLSPDSVTYLSEARNLATGRGYTDLTGRPDTTFAPGLPFLLAVGELLGLAAANAARFLNAVSYAAVVVLSWVLLRRHTRSWLLALAGATVVVAAPAMLNVADHLWSEPLFCVVLLAFFLCLDEAFTRSGRAQLRLVAAAGLLAGVAFLVRYAGMALIPAGVVALAAAPVAAGGRARARRMAAFLAAAAPLPALWLLRNALSGAPYVMGPRVPVPLGLPAVVGEFLESVGQLFARGTQLTFPWLLVLVAFVTLAAVGAVHLSRAGSELDTDRAGMLPLLAFVVIYSVFVVVAGKAAGASVDTRTVMPIFVPLVISVTWLTGLGLRAIRSPGGRVCTRVVVAVAVVGVLCMTISVTQAVVDTGSAPVSGYAADAQHEGALARSVDLLAPSSSVFTNKVWTLYSSTGREPIVPAPGPLYPSVSLVPASMDELVDASCHQGAYLAWYTPAPMLAHPKLGSLRLTRVAVDDDGVLYAVHAPSGWCVPALRNEADHGAASSHRAA